MLGKLLSRKIWMHSVCRVCGTHTLVVGSRETTDICNGCRFQRMNRIRGREGEENRGLTFLLHRRYVRACSVLFPGAGGLWAGKEFQAMLYGILLSLSAGLFTVAYRAARLTGGLIGDMQSDVWRAALGTAALLWAIGAAWGWRSFATFQMRHAVAGERG